MLASVVRRALLGMVVAVAFAASARADTVTDWNLVASNALQGSAAQGGAGQGAVSIAHLAMVHGAVYDAVNAIDRRHESYIAAPRAKRWYSKDAAAATAAYRMLTQSVPPLGLPAARVPLVDAAYAASLAAIPEGPAKRGGIATGRAAADAMIAARTNDGRGGAFRFPVGTLPGQWRLVLGNAVSDPGAWLKDVTPFVLRNPSRFGGRPPHALTSRAYARDFNEVKAIGAIASTLRSDDQTTAARFWGSANATETWSSLLRAIAERRNGSISENARMFAKCYTNGADALIVAWRDKARYLFWRPITAIREAATDGNAATEPDPDWVPLVNNPPYPEHPSGLAALGGAMVKTLQHFYRTDRAAFGVTTTAGVARSYERFSQVIQEIVDARVWSGIHFRFADKQAARIGRRVARWGNRHAFD